MLSTSTPLHFSLLQPPPQSVFIATRQLYLPSNGTIWFIGWGRLEDPLLLLWRQRGVQRDDFDIANIRPQVVDLPLDSFAGFVNFLKDGGATVNPASLYGCKRQTPTHSEQHLDKQWQCIWMIGEGKRSRPGKRWFPATVHLFQLSLHLTEEIKPGLQYALLSSLWLCCQMLQSRKTRRRTLGRHTHREPDRLKQGSLFHRAVL